MPRDTHSSEITSSADADSHANKDALGHHLLSSIASGESKDKPVSTLTKAAVVFEGTLTGMVTHGLDEAVNNPGRFGSEILGATALTLAMKGPAWVRLPALGVTALGTYAFASHAVESGSKALAITQHMTESNLGQSRAAIAETLGPLAFDSAMMVGAGYAGGRLAGLLPKTLPTVSLEMGPQLAFEGVGLANSGPRLRFEFPEAPKANVMAMSGEAGGGGRYFEKDGYRILSSRGGRGEDIQLVDKVPVGKTVELLHGDHSVSLLGSSGKIVIKFPTGEARMLDLGKPIKRVSVSEFADGQKQYRLNETALPNMEVNNVNHEVKAVLGNGDKLHMVDNVPDGFMSFTHQDGLKSWVEHSGRLVFQLPNGVLSEATIPSKLSNIRLVERLDGSKQFQFLNPAGEVLPQKVELPAKASTAKTFDEIKQWRDLKNYLAGRTATISGDAFEVHRVEPNAGGVIHQREGGKENFPFWNPRVRNLSTNRLFDQQFAGVDPRTMRGNDLSTPADMALAQQDHSWITKRYLSGLNRQDDPFGNR